MTKRFKILKNPGVYFRECANQHCGRPDRSYDISWQDDGKKMWKNMGRASEGMDAAIAKAERISIIAGLRKPKPDLKDPTVGAVLDAWFASGRSRSDRFTCEKHVRPALGGLRMSEVTPSVLTGFMKGLGETGLCPQSITHVMRYLSAMVNMSIRDGRWTGANPLSRNLCPPKPKIDNRSERFLTRREAELLTAALKDRSAWWHDAARFALYTGARLTEIYRLRAEDLKPDGGEIMITAKGGKREALILVPEAADILAERIRLYPRADGLVFGKKRPYVFKKVVDELGFNAKDTDRRRRVWFHTLRHTFASWLVRNGADIYAVQKLMRHSTIAMTQRYAHLGPDSKRERLEIIRRMMNPEPAPATTGQPSRPEPEACGG